MGAFARQLCCRAHAPTYYNGAYLDLHAVIVRAELGYGQHRLLVKRQPTTPIQSIDDLLQVPESCRRSALNAIMER